MRRAHAVAVEEDQRRWPRRAEHLIESQPQLAIATALAVGVALGWLIKRKEW